VARADELLARAHDVLTGLSNGPALATCEIEMARCALLRGAFDDAVSTADRAIARFSGETIESSNARVVRALALALSGRVDAGTAEMGEAARQLEALGAPREAAQAWREFGEALIQSGRPEMAVEALRNAADCAGIRSFSVPVNASAHAAGRV
jgi:tetratricopeptide (TPR) repeat protein